MNEPVATRLPPRGERTHSLNFANRVCGLDRELCEQHSNHDAATRVIRGYSAP